MLAVLVVAAVVGVVPAAAAGAGALSGGLTHDEAFVTAAYQDFLHRLPSPDELGEATAVPLHSAPARAGVVSGLSMSAEWIGVTVEKLYEDTLGRAADAGGKAYWVGILSSRRLTVAQVAASFYSSSEYFTGFGHSSVSTWVSDLYTKVLLRDGAQDPSGVAYWVALTGSAGRWAVAYSVYQSSESCHTRVKELYEVLLGRDPDVGGWDYWAGLIGGSGDLALAASLASSDEYYDRAWDRYGPPPAAPPGAPMLVATTDGPQRFQPAALNGAGVVVGALGDGSDPAWCVLPCTTATLLQRPSGFPTVEVMGVSSSGLVVGYGESAAGGTQGLVWESAGAAPAVLQGAVEDVDVLLAGVSPAGLIIGSSGTSVGLVWSSADAAPTELQAPSGFTTALPTAASSSGVIVGRGKGPSNTNQALVWSSAEATPTVLQSPPGFTNVSARGISSGGVILGSGIDPSSHLQQLVWSSADAAPTVLQVPAGYTIKSGVGGLSGDALVGAASDSSGSSHALLWSSPLSSPTILDGPVDYSLFSVVGVSSAGDVVGMGANSSGYAQGVLWSQ